MQILGRNLGVNLNSHIPSLLVDVVESLALSTVLKKNGSTDDEKSIHPDHSEHGSEDVVEEDICEGCHWADAAAHEGRRGRRGADVIGNESGGGAVEVATTFELKRRKGFSQTLDANKGTIRAKTYRGLH